MFEVRENSGYAIVKFITIYFELGRVVNILELFLWKKLNTKLVKFEYHEIKTFVSKFLESTLTMNLRRKFAHEFRISYRLIYISCFLQMKKLIVIICMVCGDRLNCDRISDCIWWLCRNLTTFFETAIVTCRPNSCPKAQAVVMLHYCTWGHPFKY